MSTIDQIKKATRKYYSENGRLPDTIRMHDLALKSLKKEAAADKLMMVNISNNFKQILGLKIVIDDGVDGFKLDGGFNLWE